MLIDNEQNIPMINVANFFSEKTFSLMECWKKLKSSYKLIKFGFYKQSMISLRVVAKEWAYKNNLITLNNIFENRQRKFLI